MNIRHALIRAVTFLGGLYFLLEFILPPALFIPGDAKPYQFGLFHEQITNGFLVMGSMALGLGVINIFMIHGGKVAFRRRGWGYSSCLLVGLFSMLAITWMDWGATVAQSKQIAQITMLRDFSLLIVSDAQAKTSERKTPRERNQLLEREVANLSKSLLTTYNADLAPQLPAPDGDRLRALSTDIASSVSELGTLSPVLLATSETASDLKINQKVAATLSEVSQLVRESLAVTYRHSWLRLAYTLLYDGLFVALGAAMFALLGFYIAAAAFRAFRIKSTESALMMVAATIVMLGQIPFGLWIWDGLPALRLWLLEVPSSAAFRGVKFGAAVAGLVMAYRMWLSIESESFSSSHTSKTGHE